MPYIDCAYLATKYPDVIDALGGCPSTLIDTAIAEASAEADLYWQRYLPIVNPDDFIKSIVADIAIYRAKQDESTEIDYQRYKEALRKLELIQDGKLSLKSTSAGNTTGQCVDRIAFGTQRFAEIDKSAY